MKINIKQIVEKLVKGAKESTSEGNWIYAVNEVEECFKIILNNNMINEITDLLEAHEDVADVQVYNDCYDDCIDIMLYQGSF